MQLKPQPKMKTTSVISVAAARALYHACRFALPQGGGQSRNGCPPSNVSAPVALNLMVTIQWNLTKTGKDNFADLIAIDVERPEPSQLRDRREILDLIDPYPVHVRTLPGFKSLVDGKVKVQDLQEVDIADLPPEGIEVAVRVGVPKGGRALPRRVGHGVLLHDAVGAFLSEEAIGLEPAVDR